MDIDIATLVAFVKRAEAYRPVVDEAIKAAKSYGPEAKKLLENLSLAVADIHSAVVKRYEENGFNRDEAILLTLNEKMAFRHISERMERNNK